MFPFSSYSNGYILTDFKMIKEAFSQKELSNREGSEKQSQEIASDRAFIGLDKKAHEILGPDDQLIKNGPGNFIGIGDGPYDAVHKSFRQMWFDTSKRLTGKNRMIEIMQQSSSSVNEILLREGSKESGMDPKRVFMNGTMNVITGFAFGNTMEFDDPVFKEIANAVTTIFKFFSVSILKRTIAGKVPSWVTRNFVYQRIWHSFLKERNEVVLKFHEFLHKQIVNHRIDLDKNNPRDYLDMLLIAAEKEKRLGYDVVVATVLGIYLGASDTLANQLSWFCVTLADHPEVQEKMYEEIIASLDNENEIKKENCPFTRSVLLECQRWNPVVDSLLHRASEDIVVDGVFIEKGSTLQASLTAVMHNPANFPEPEKFIPDRFYKNGEFVNDVKVVSFSIGLRNCIGKQIAIDEYFIFTTNIIRDFRLSRKSKSMKIANHRFLRIPEEGHVRFEKRN
ncbi:Oidioi.mRNA.OKI2018_I69.chr2.g7699.t1.cds [Oikopleura dioica]|uniref:Oidioi.mRNA.OKI2018_I69.chr2.g7699.t1.cds n=1 Tax=Oikopleura dioica TaxID=34765 RepID=A0ABN7T7L7_OIKDI|nr:Oidioi.mRNA.OKI2018_I69.chr2.g7699.t1.cds [Oikopleura dioica]